MIRPFQLVLIALLLIKIGSQNYMLNYNEPNTDWPTTCSTGINQSPIDFTTGFTSYNSEVQKIKVLEMKYGTDGNGLISGKLEVQSNRYVLTGTKFGSIIVMKDQVKYQYDLVDISFHIPSEHTFAGYKGDMEMHLHHKKSSDYIKANAISDADKMTELTIAIIFRLGLYFDNVNISRLNVGTRNTNSVQNFNVGIYPPIGKPFLFYEGSKTTPNCDETVNWLIVHQWELVSQNQYLEFRDWIQSTYISQFVRTTSNARSTKSLGKRLMYYQYYNDQKVIQLSSQFIYSHVVLTVLLYIIFF